MHKIINDPVHGFIAIKSELIHQCIEHPYFQRLRHISQLGLTHFVYPGAHHSRFHHALGAYHLMQVAIQQLRNKGIQITEEEDEAASIAILLHDIGHGPYSHTLEYKLWKGVSHETISKAIIRTMNKDLDGRLDLAIKIFENQYSRPFFYQLISSQLDVDRLDYLKRDSFFTGVVEGNIGVDRILAMLDVVDDKIVVHEKGIMSIQNFLLTRNLMYWQVYLHKTVMSAENMLVKVIDRVIELRDKDGYFHTNNKSLSYFFDGKAKDFHDQLEVFSRLDDADIWMFLKELQSHQDLVLRTLSSMLVHRKLYKVSLTPFESNMPSEFEDPQVSTYFKFDHIVNMVAYSETDPIWIIKKNGNLVSYLDYILQSGHLITQNNVASRRFYYQLNS